MANVPESPAWEPGIYQLEVTDPVLGGVDGIDNLQAKQLANRTAFLKAEVTRLDGLVGTISGGTTDHNALSNRSSANQHPISAIEGLETALNAKAGTSHAHNASAITAGVLDSARLPAASTAQSGIVRLVDDLTTTSTTQALTANQGKVLKDLINSASGGTTDHNALSNRSSANQHPISAIGGLETALNAKAGTSHTHNASAITAGVLDSARLPAASTAQSGIVQLIDNLLSTSVTQALTANQGRALKALIDSFQKPLLNDQSSVGNTTKGYVEIPLLSGKLFLQYITKQMLDGEEVSYPIVFPNKPLVIVGNAIYTNATTFISVTSDTNTPAGYQYSFFARAANLSTNPPSRWSGFFAGTYFILGH